MSKREPEMDDNIMGLIHSDLAEAEPLWNRFSMRHYSMKRFVYLKDQFSAEPEPNTTPKPLEESKGPMPAAPTPTK